MTNSTIESAIHWLTTQTNSNPSPDLSRLNHALSYLGNPHHDLPVIHITGTNGKGSTTAFLSDLLMSQGFRVATFTSPHIMAFNERIAINNIPISDEELIALTNEMQSLNEYMQTTEFGSVMAFELYTLMAIVHFSRKKCDVCLFEVGIGGLLDSTNVLNGQIAVITTIGLDHAEKLGNTLESVAEQKSGIIKPNETLITGKIDASPLAIIQQTAQNQQATHYHYERDFAIRKVHEASLNGTTFDYQSQNGTRELLSIQMLGGHQLDNVAVALKTFESWCEKSNHQIDWQKAAESLKKTTWLARLECINEQPLIYIDGAHNHAGLMALKQSVESLFDGYDLTILYSGLSTKDQSTQLHDLDNFNAKKIVLTEFDHRYSMRLDNFKRVVSNTSQLSTLIEFVSDWKTFIQNYQQTYAAHPKSVLLVTGSLYFVSDVRQLFY
ncbi:MAG: folylpolyglutamate synthase/dihydrofolate synthase family protein [Aerococcaceae bacterium]|nr:folylpolyglutamate synthase/dihydrofolate synthase family protein [Aerococcaceae bacterium]